MKPGLVVLADPLDVPHATYPPGSTWKRRDGSTAKAGPLVHGPSRRERRANASRGKRLYREHVKKTHAFVVKAIIRWGKALRRFLS